MNFIGTSKERFFYHNTLLCLVKSLQEKNITIDLRNDSYVCGQLVSVDGYMNLSLTNVVYCDTQQIEYYFDNLFIQARNIRYIHIPETIEDLTRVFQQIELEIDMSKTKMSILGNINNELNRGRMKKPNLTPVTQPRKAKKALQQHMQTVAELNN